MIEAVTQSPWPMILGLLSLLIFVLVLLFWVKPGIPVDLPQEMGPEAEEMEVVALPMFVIPDDDGSLSAALRAYFAWCDKVRWSSLGTPSSQHFSVAGQWFHAISTRWALVSKQTLKFWFNSPKAMWEAVSSGEMIPSSISASAGHKVNHLDPSTGRVKWSVGPGTRGESVGGEIDSLIQVLQSAVDSTAPGSLFDGPLKLTFLGDPLALREWLTEEGMGCLRQMALAARSRIAVDESDTCEFGDIRLQVDLEGSK